MYERAYVQKALRCTLVQQDNLDTGGVCREGLVSTARCDDVYTLYAWHLQEYVHGLLY
jgi:hypothetical protein